MADIEMTPITRKEFYLAGITGMDVQAPSPVTRLESYLNDILNGTVSQLTPLNRVECYLAKISGADVRIPVPMTRLEVYLAAIAGEDIEVPDPVTREEHWLWQWANAGPGGLVETITGTLPLTLANALSHAIVSLTRYGLCTQDGTPTPDAPVDIVTNNGALKFGWYDIITTSQLSGYGTYVSPSGTAGNRAYKWLRDLPNGTYTFAVDGDYELIVQWRDPADPSVLVPSSYENLSGWMTSGEAVLDKESGGYGIAVRRTVGTSSITPSNFDGTLHVQEQGIYTDGTPEVLTVSGANLLNSATNITGKYITASGSISNGNDAQYTDLIPVKAGEIYVCSFVSGRNSGNNRWHGYNENGTWVKQLASVSASVQQGAKLIMTATIDSGISYVRLSYGINDTEAMIEGIISDSISDKFYLGEMSSSRGRLYSLTDIQSPYTSTNKIRCPATLYSVIPGRHYAVKNNVPPAEGLFTGFYASIDDVTNISKSLSGASGSSFFAPNGANYAVTVYLKDVSGTTYTFDKPIVSEVSTDYSPYVPPQTASVPMLLSVGNYADEVELISGIKTGKVGIKVLDGTESGWALSDSGSTHRFRGVKPSDCHTPASRAPSVCTHFKYVSTGSPVGGMFIGASQYWYFILEDQTIDTVDEWTDWLAAQYAAGTPVIVLYPLATETTEQITAQHLDTNEGTNVVDSVANVSPLEAEVKYMAASAQDVLSKLLGMKVTKKDISTQDAENMIDIITGEENK